MVQKRTRRQLPDEVKVDFSKLDFNDLTIGELESFEEIAGADSVERAMTGKVGPKAAVALAFILLRRDYPDLTIEEVRERKVTEIFQGGDVEEAPNPQSANASS